MHPWSIPSCQSDVCYWYIIGYTVLYINICVFLNAKSVSRIQKATFHDRNITIHTCVQTHTHSCTYTHIIEWLQAALHSEPTLLSVETVQAPVSQTCPR